MSSSTPLAKNRFEVLFNLSKDGVAFLDLDSNFLDFNPAYLSMTEFTRQELLTKNCIRLSAPADRQPMTDVIQQVITQGRVEDFKKTSIVKDGKSISINMSLAYLADTKQILITTKNITEELQLIKSLKSLANYDSLTLLPNRYTLNEKFKSLQQNLNNHQKLYLCIFDLDDFKSINDKYGFSKGDQLLKQVGKRLQSHQHENGIVSRVAGDEFVMIMLENSKDQLLERLKTILNDISQPYKLELSSDSIKIFSSIGITQLTNKDQELDNLLRQAEQAIHKSKRQGKNSIEFFSHKDSLFYEKQKKCLTNITQAIANNELVLHYQPKVNLRSGDITSFEALIRWQSAEKGLVYPNDFIPYIENSDLIITLGEWVARETIKQISAWKAQGYEWTVAINISAKHFQHPSFMPFIKQLFNEHPELSPSLLEIEILESIAIEDMSLAKDIISQGQYFGLSFSLDDFGTGYSSLSYLKTLQVNTLKIDRSFIQDMLRDTDNMMLVEAIINLAKIFKLEVIAEGLESVEHGIVLLRYGCNLAQGYGIAKPMPSDRVIPWAKSFIPHPNWALWADALWDKEDFPLLIAETDHLLWVENILLEMNAPSSTPDLSQINTHFQCRFGHWYYQHGMQHYRELAAFKEIEPIHQEIHRIGKIMFELKLAGDLPAAHQYINTLLELKDKIIALLKGLQRSFIKQIESK